MKCQARRDKEGVCVCVHVHTCEDEVEGIERV